MINLPRIITRADALAAGFSGDQVRSLVRRGDWQALDRGTYLTRVEHLPEAYTRERVTHTDRCIAAARRHPGSAIAFGSAAIARGLPLVSGIPRHGQLAVPDGGWTGIRRGVRYRLMHTEPTHVTEFDPYDEESPIPITTVARTLADIARTMPRADALAAGDAALRLELATPQQVLDILVGMRHVRGCRTAQEVVPLWDARRETALESWSALRFWEWGLPQPTPQVDFYDDEGFIGRVDFFWEEYGVIGEADGRLKYDVPGALYDEKRREDRLRRTAACRDLIRWGWPDLRSPRDRILREHLRTALR